MDEHQETQFHSLAGDEVVAFQLPNENQPVSEAKSQLTDTAINGGLSLKLKIPKSESMEEDLRRSPTDVLRTCSECGKQFTSGKALGGHKRACLQKKIQTTTIKKVVAMKLDRDQTPTNNELKTGLNCYVCKQSFRSLKSLYGHMRKHPEREWRGIQPPQAANNYNNSSTVSNDNDQQDDSSDEGRSTVDLVESLKSWSVKARRGYRILDNRASTSISEEEDTEAMQQAVNDLLMLAEHGSDFEDGKRSDILRNNMNQGKGKTEFEAEDTKKTRCNSEDTWVMNDYEDDSEMEISGKMKQQQKKKKRRLNELDDIEGVNEDSTAQIYYCPICNKAFAKHQALGGHVASHNKNKNGNTLKDSSASEAETASEDGNRDANIASKIMENDERQVASEETGEFSRIAAAAIAAADEHQCNICSKTFPTGQALGGHKRCHWVGPAEAFSSTSQVTTSAGEVTQTTHRVVLDFDLNDTPPEYYQVFGGAAAAAS